jgi:hypothetical protein
MGKWYSNDGHLPSGLATQAPNPSDGWTIRAWEKGGRISVKSQKKNLKIWKTSPNFRNQKN